MCLYISNGTLRLINLYKLFSDDTENQLKTTMRGNRIEKSQETSRTERSNRSYSSSPSPPPRKRKFSSSRLDQQSSDEPSSSKGSKLKRKSRALRPQKISTCSGNKGRSESETSSSDENIDSPTRDHHCSDCPKAYQGDANCKHRFELKNNTQFFNFP